MKWGRRITTTLTFLFFVTLIFMIGLTTGLWIERLRFRQQVVLPVPASNLVDSVLQYIRLYYVDSVDTRQLLEDVVEALLSRLDPYSIYLPPVLQAEERIHLEGELEGIGIEFTLMEDTVVVLTVLPGGPAEEAGLLPGDRILQVDSVPIAGRDRPSLTRIVQLIRGARGTFVRLTVFRPGQGMLTFRIERDVIQIRSVDAALMLTDQIGYLRIALFSEETPEEVREAVQELLESGMTCLILDLRDNAGGILQSAVAVADEFLPGRKLVTYTEGRAYPREEFWADQPGTFEEGPLIVLVNRYTASASEILAAALQYWKRALVIGERTHGKGMVQRVVPLSNGGALRLTVAYYYTPDGRNIQRPWRGATSAVPRLVRGMASGDTLSQGTDSLRVFESGATWGVQPDIQIDTLLAQWNFTLRYGQFNRLFLQFVYDLPGSFFNGIRARYPDFMVFAQSYETPESLYRQFWDWLVRRKGIRMHDLDPDSLAPQDKEQIRFLLKMYIARHIWGLDGFYAVLARKDPAIQKALEIFREQQCGELLL